MSGRYFPWLLLALFCFLVSLGKPYIENYDIPALVFPLEQLRDSGRPLSIACLVGLLYCASKTPRQFFETYTPPAFRYLLVLQGIIFLKNVFYGNSTTALLLIITYTLFITVMTKGVMKWLCRDGFAVANWSLVMAGAIFVLLNAYQAIQSTYPVTVINGQFSGTTNNPQMAALTLVPVVPCLLFQLEKQASTQFKKAFYLVILLLVLCFIWWTASRTGFLMAVASIVFFYRFRQGALFRTAVVIGLVAAIALPLVQPFFSTGADVGGTSLTLLGKLQSGGDTRTAVWRTLLNTFLSYPIFGAPLQGERLGFGENSWLAVGATTGLIGLLPLVMFGYECLKTMGKMLQISRQVPAYYFHCSTVIAGIAGLMVGSMFEAFLVGILSMPITALLFFMLLGDYIIKESQYYKACQEYQLMNCS
jgi:hypothetical protein